MVKKLFFILILISCFRTISRPKNNIIDATGTVKITFVNVVNDSPMLLRSVNYQNPFGETYTINKFKYYVSNIVARSSSNSFSEINSYHLINQEDPANGLTLNNYLCDSGRMKITGDSKDSLKFKVPSLRNIARTQPYMHDGRFYTLDQVFDHYTKGIAISATLDTLLKNKIVMTDLEKRDLKYFLWTLTDTSFLKNPRFSQP